MATARRSTNGNQEPITTKKIMIVYFADGTIERINANRLNLMIAFELEHPGKDGPETYQEMAWLAWHALGRKGTLEEFIETVEELDAAQVERGKAAR